MTKSRFVLRLLLMLPVVVIPLFVLLVATLITDVEDQSYQQALEQVEADFIKNEKSRLENKVNNIVDLVEFTQKVNDDNTYMRIKKRVEDAQDVALSLFYQYQNSMSESQLKAHIIETLRSLEWNSGESYIWVIDMQGVLQLGPSYLKPKEGQSLLHVKGPDGRETIKEEIAVVANKKQGFLRNTFTKPGFSSDKQFEQISFVKHFEKFGWYFGSAEFLDTITKRSQKVLLEKINHVGKSEFDYVFVLDAQGRLLLDDARQDLLGKDLRQAGKAGLRELVEKLMQAGRSDKDNFVTYNWINPNTGLYERKISYVKSVNNSNWVIGCGFYPSMIKGAFEEQKQKITQQYAEEMQSYNNITWLSVIVAIMVSSLMSFVSYYAWRKLRGKMEESHAEIEQLNLGIEQDLIAKNKEIERLKTTLNDLRILDTVTLLPNRNYILQRLNQELNRANRYRSALSLITVDIINKPSQIDHAHFQNTMARFSGSLTKVLRNTDIIGRLGSSEFLILMPEISLTEAKKTALRVQSTLTSVHDELCETFEICISATQYEHDQKLSDLLSDLDESLYLCQQKSVG